MEISRKQGILGRLALILLALIWGFAFIVMKNTLDSIGQFQLLAMRFFIASLSMALITGKKLFTMGKEAFIGAIIIGIATGLAYAVQNTGLKYTTPGKNAFLTAFYCVLTPFICWLMYKRRPQTRNIIAAFICITGMGFVSLGSGDLSLGRGDVLSICGGVFFAVQIVIMEYYAGKASIFAITTVQFLFASLTNIVLLLFSGNGFDPVPSEAWTGILYLALFSSAIGNALQLYGQKYTPSAPAAVIMSLEAVFAAMFSIIFGMESLTPAVAAGFVLIFSSILINEVKADKTSSDDKDLNTETEIAD